MISKAQISAQLADISESVERGSVVRLFNTNGTHEPNEILEALAAFAASSDQLRRSDPRLIDDLAHLLSDDQDLLSRAYIEKRRVAELAIELFISAGFITKAATLTRAYRKATGKLYSIQSAAGPDQVAVALSRELLWALLIQDPKTLSDIANKLSAAVRDPQTGVDEARYFAVAHAVAQASQNILFQATPIISRRVFESRGELLTELAVLTGQPRLLQTAKRIALLVIQIAQMASSYALSGGNGALSGRMREALYGEASDCRVPVLWPPQLRAISDGLLSSPYYVVSAPTSSGKTFLAELKIATYLDRRPDGLAVYVAPYNALAKQIADALTQRFRTAGIAPALVWSGTYEIDYRELGSAALLVTTPEKLDGIVRSAQEDNSAGIELRRRVGLFIFDEMHLIASQSRGVTYELLVTRLRRLFPTAEALAMSAVCDNAASLARWFAERQSAYTKDGWAPTRRRILIYRRNGELSAPSGVAQVKLSKWSNTGDSAARLALQLHAGGAGPTLILCTQVRYAISIAEKIAEAQPLIEVENATLAAAAIEIRNLVGVESLLARLIELGIGYHYRGLPEQVKGIVEDLARKGLLRYVCSTTTLAEGVHLRFRSLIIPYFNFGGPDFINRSLLKNIIGRAGRAEVNLKATVIFLEPGAGMVRNHFYNELIGRFDEDIEICSAVPKLAAPSGTIDDFESALRLEAQILGVVQDRTFLDDQPGHFANATFAAQDNASLIADLFRKKFQQMEKRKPPLLTRNSPYELTGFGRATAISGISDVSGRVIIRELDYFFNTNSAWFRSEDWAMRPVSSDLIENITSLIVTPFEFFQRTSHAQVRRMDTVIRAREWARQRDAKWISLTAPDRFVFGHWIRGASAGEIVSCARLENISAFPFDEKDDALAIAQVHEYLEETREFSLWMLSAAIRISEQYCRELKIKPEPPFRKSVSLLESGVSSDVAIRLLGLGVPRAIAAPLAPGLFHLADADDEIFVPTARRAVEALLLQRPQLALGAGRAIESLL